MYDGGDGPHWSRVGVVVGALGRVAGTDFAVDPGRVGIAEVGMGGAVEEAVGADTLGAEVVPDTLAIEFAPVGVGALSVVLVPVID